MKPGGRVVVESFALRPPPQPARPVDIAATDLLTAFGSYEILVFEEVEAKPDWQESEQPVVRMIAVAP